MLGILVAGGFLLFGFPRAGAILPSLLDKAWRKSLQEMLGLCPVSTLRGFNVDLGIGMLGFLSLTSMVQIAVSGERSHESLE